MKSNAIKRTLSSFIILLSIITFMPVHASDTVSLTGSVSYNYQFTTDDGESYMIGDNEKGLELEDLAGQRVKVSGKLSEIDGELYIFVESFNVIEESG
jgi:hypothetical protein